MPCSLEITKELPRNRILLKKLILDDICYGYELVIPRGNISRLPNACMAPMNITKQFTLNAKGEIVDNERLTHNQSF